MKRQSSRLPTTAPATEPSTPSGAPAIAGGPAALLSLQRRAGNAVVNRLLAQRRTEPVIRRRIDPDFPTKNGGPAANATQMRDYFDKWVKPEAKRVVDNGTVDDAIVGRIESGVLRLPNLLAAASRPHDPTPVADVQVELDALVADVNLGADAITGDIDQAYTDYHQIRNQQPGAEDDLRHERKRREGILVPAGTRHQNMIRGFQSAQEATNLFNNLIAQLHGAGVGDAEVAARGSAVRGMNRDYDRPYREGTGDNEMANDSSDIDFFFFSPTLEAVVTWCQARGVPGWRGGGNIHPDDLSALLTNPAFNVRLTGAGFNPAALDAAITAFPAATKAAIGRKSDVTLLRAAQLAAFTPDEYVLV